MCPVYHCARTKGQDAADRRAGVGRLGSGQPYINGWPAGRKPVLCNDSVRQSLGEAAGWAEKAFDVARWKATELAGEPLLLGQKTLRYSSSFTGLLVFHIYCKQHC